MYKLDQSDGFVSEDLSEVRNQNAELQAQVGILQESWDEAAGAMLRMRGEDKGWSLLGQVDSNDGFTLGTLKQVAEKVEIQQVGNPLLKQGFYLRFSPIFSRGFQMEGLIKPRFQRKLDEPSVQQTLFTAEAHEALEKTCFNVGNLFVAYNRISGRMMRIPFKEITNRAVDPDLPTATAYYQWSHTRTGFDGKMENIVEWIPLVEWWNAGLDTVDEIAKSPVNHEWVIIDQRVNVPTSGHWGIPDAFPAYPYAWAYSEYIRDAASMIKALQMFAWKILGKSKTQAQTAGVAAASSRRVGGVAAMTRGTDIEAMPKSGQVDMADGLALAAMAASAMGVPTPALISTVSGNGAAAVQSLDGPTVAMARGRQARWVDFYRRVFMAMGIEDVTVNFPKITEDPIHRQVSSLAVGRTTGALFADEYRNAFLEAMSVTPTHTGTPDVEEYAQAQNALGFLQRMESLSLNDSEGGDPLARQGNSGVAGRLGEIDNTSRDQARISDHSTQTALVG